MEKIISDKSLLSTELFLPENFKTSGVPEVSIVVPALNEELTISEFIDWCWEGLKNANIIGEIIIIDSSDDSTPNIALSKGAKVVRTPRRGLGQAYKDSLPYIEGKFIIMGDCDLTYDFRELTAFIQEYFAGKEFIMGSRFLGEIEKDSMPKLHQYFGTPLTTWALNKLYRGTFSDIHCGMRGITKKALERISISSTGWEYASEMILKALILKLQISEVPIKFYKDREGRSSHHKRSGALSPWIAGIKNIKVMMVYSPTHLSKIPGMLFLISGVVLSLFPILIPGVKIFGIGLSVNALIFGLFFVVAGQTFLIHSKLHENIVYSQLNINLKVENAINYWPLNGLFFLFGLFGLFLFIYFYVRNGLTSNGISLIGIVSIYALFTSLQLTLSTLTIELLKRKT